jgi:glutamate-ammonia-ligase adenylyltransferase
MGAIDIERVHFELTQLAEVCLQFALDESRRALRLQKLPLAIIGLGKFGGLELGYGADLDVLFVGGRSESDQADASRLGAQVIDFMARRTTGGNLFEVDARLRPDGTEGPLASTVEAHRHYYENRAQLWERQALIKARVVAGDARVGESFMQMAREYVYARPLTMEQAREIREMRRRIEAERGDQGRLDLEFKTGPGGLIDVEFLVQALQLRYGSEQTTLRTAHTLAAINRLASVDLLEEDAAFQLRRHYLFLRRIESTLRREENLSVSHLPADEAEQRRLARRLGFEDRTALLEEYRHAIQRVRALYERLMPGG